MATPLPDSSVIEEWSISNPEASEAEATEPTAADAKLAATEIVIIDSEDSDSQSCVIFHHLLFY